MEQTDKLIDHKLITSPHPVISMRHAKSQNHLPLRKNAKVPSFEEIARLTGSIVNSKKPCYETFPPPPRVKSERKIKLARHKLSNIKKGVNYPCWFPQSNEIPYDIGAFRFTSRPHEFIDSSQKIFPTFSMTFHQIPKTTSERFSEIDTKKDTQLANYAVNSTNAFKTEWQKHKNLKNRKLFPEKHPEFTGLIKDNNIKKDKIGEYREAMLKVKAMMNKAWGSKK